MKKIVILFFIFTLYSCCNLPLVDCVRSYYYMAEEGECKNDNQSFCYSDEEINVKVSPTFINIGMNNDGNGIYQVKLVISVKKQTNTEVTIDNNNLHVYCLMDNDTITTSLDAFEYNIDTINKDIILMPDFVVDKKYRNFFNKHHLGVDLKLSDNITIQSRFKIKVKS